LVAQATEVAPGFYVLALPGAWGADPPVVELSLAIDTPEGIVLLVGCSHPTIERIVQAARAAIDEPVHMIVGGTHLLPAEGEEIQRIATALRDDWKVEWIAPAHCTGEPAFEILKDTFGDRYIYAGLGTTIAALRKPAGDTSLD
jgi:7,8-dihydropterin-6-yl-methyl-4-(beta-D-ribofuranosyl)aminobenzene 5'-phosphate synthase